MVEKERKLKEAAKLLDAIDNKARPEMVGIEVVDIACPGCSSRSLVNMIDTPQHFCMNCYTFISDGMIDLKRMANGH